MSVKISPKDRWCILFGKLNETGRFALQCLYKKVQSFLTYTLVCESTESPDRGCNRLVIAVGNDPILKDYTEKGIFVNETRKEGYSIRVFHETEGKTTAVIQGADENGLLYGVDDFIHFYIGGKARYQGYIYSGPARLFMDEMPEWEIHSAPAVENRGLWTWGHVIHDWKGYIDNCALWKFNTVIVWNDFLPINASDICEYAHTRGIRIVWGFTWCWGEQVDPNDPKQLAKWKERVLDTYERDYADCGDGIYFQTFTETSETSIGGKPIAELAVDWVNSIAGELLERHPGLWLQFGLHATSIRERAEVLAKTDERITIVWEDAGGFPYAYEPSRQEEFPDTMKYQEILTSLRGNKERYGAVLKGFSLIDWKNEFEHQQGTFLLGEADPRFLESWAEKKKLFFDWAKGWWICGAPLFREFLDRTVSKPLLECTVTALVEDSAWEVKQWTAVCLFAEMLWDTTTPVNELIRKVLQCPDCE